ncbi:MAG: hypothetical protein HYS80_01995 [Candidatus Aenigmarchaeota archaeon]|nr:hypothetical protein [Candidatus Aenigmarchaeota archaeon]
MTKKSTELYQPYFMRPESGLDIPPFIFADPHNLGYTNPRSYGEFLRDSKGGHFNPREHRELLYATRRLDLPPFLSHLKFPTPREVFDKHFADYKPTLPCKN